VFAARDDGLVQWLRRVHPTTTWTTSVCTGALYLAAAGILDGIDATTHWARKEQLERLGARYTDQRVVERGKVITAAGVSSGIDMALTLLDRIYGPAVAKACNWPSNTTPSRLSMPAHPPRPRPRSSSSPRRRSRPLLQKPLADLRHRQRPTVATAARRSDNDSPVAKTCAPHIRTELQVRSPGRRGAEPAIGVTRSPTGGARNRRYTGDDAKRPPTAG
jgi:hypothetical protein